jgi:hypothetical protein
LQIGPYFLLGETDFVVTFAASTLAYSAVWGKSDASRATNVSTSEVCVENRALGNSSTDARGSQSSAVHREGRGVWVLTAYGISGLALFGILFYYVSSYVTH